MKKYLFDQLVIDDTSKFKKIKKENYLKEGKFSIVDQGKALIAGYTNDITFINQTNIPIIIFGDHTRVFKYIDFPIALGADGVKALTINKKLAYCKYIYYFFKSVILPEAGYSRHFKYLKDVRIPVPENYDDQIRISAILTKAEALIAKRKESITALDELLKSIFIEMFGDPVLNEKGWSPIPLGDKLTIKHGYAFKGEYFSNKGEYILLTPGNFFEEGGYKDREEKQKYYRGQIPSEYILNKGDVLIAMTEQAPGLLGSSLIIPESNKFLHNQRLGLIMPKKGDLNKFYLFHLFNHYNIRRLIHSKATGTKVRHTSPTKLEEIMVALPPLTLQNQFAAIVEKVEAIKQKYTQSINELENLYNSISKLVFKGELDLSKIPIYEEMQFEEQKMELGETKIGYESPEIETKKTFSEKELKKHIKQKPLKSFTFNELWEDINNNFDDIPHYDRIKKMVFDMLEGKKPTLTQTFDPDKKEIILKVKV